MSAFAIAQSPLRLPCGGRGRALLTLPCRVSCGAPNRLVAPHPHRPPCSALNAVRGSAALSRIRLALAGFTVCSCACVRPSPRFPLPPRGCLASSVYSALAVLTVCSCACVRPSPRFPLPPRGCLASSASCALAVAVRVGYRSARHFCSWVSNGNGARRSRPPHDPIFIEPTLRTLNDEKR